MKRDIQLFYFLFDYVLIPGCAPFTAFQCLYDSKDFEDSIRNCISIGGDCDTTATICGAVSQTVYGIPKELERQIRSYLDKNQLATVDSFNEKFVLPFRAILEGIVILFP